MKTFVLTACVCVAAAIVAGCVSARAPENIYIGSGPRAAEVDSSRVPHTETHEQARAELTQAYQQIRYLEHELDRCRGKLEDAREEADAYEEKYDRLKDKYDD